MQINPVREQLDRIAMGQAVANQVRRETLSAERAAHDQRAFAAIRSQAAEIRQGHVDFFA